MEDLIENLLGTKIRDEVIGHACAVLPACAIGHVLLTVLICVMPIAAPPFRTIFELAPSRTSRQDPTPVRACALCAYEHLDVSAEYRSACVQTAPRRPRASSLPHRASRWTMGTYPPTRQMWMATAPWTTSRLSTSLWTRRGRTGAHTRHSCDCDRTTYTSYYTFAAPQDTLNCGPIVERAEPAGTNSTHKRRRVFAGGSAGWCHPRPCAHNASSQHATRAALDRCVG